MKSKIYPVISNSPWGKLCSYSSDHSATNLTFSLSDLSLSSLFLSFVYSRPKNFNALALFQLDFSSCWLTTTPGKWVILTALSVLTDCPPGPPDLKTSILKSEFFNLTSTSSLLAKQLPLLLKCVLYPGFPCRVPLEHDEHQIHTLNKSKCCYLSLKIISLNPSFTFWYINYFHFPIFLNTLFRTF